MAPTFYRYSNPLTQLKSLGLASWANGVLIGAWYEALTFELVSGVISLAPASGVGIFGYAAKPRVDTSGTASLLRDQATFTQLTSGGAVTNYLAPSGAVQTALFSALVISGSVPYMTDVNGNIYKFAAGAVSEVGTFNVPTRGLTIAGNSLYAMAPISGTIVSASLASLAVTGSVATPFPTPACITSSGIYTAVGGWGQAQPASGFSFIANSPTNALFLTGITSGASGFTSWTENTSGIWTRQQFLNNTVAPTQLAWTPLGNTLMATNQTSGTVDVYGLSVNTLTFSQTLSIAGAKAVAIAPGSTNGLVCSPGANLVTSIYISGPSWAVSGAVAIGSPQCVLALNDGAHALVGSISGLATMALAVNQWSLVSTVTLPFAPQYLAADGTNAFAAGVSGSSGWVYAASSTASGYFIGGVSGLVAIAGQVIALDSAGVLRFFDESTLTLQASATIASGALCLSVVNSEVWVGYQSSTLRYALGAPFSLQQVKYGEVGVYNTSTSGWVTTGLGPTLIPEAMTFDSSGNVTVATLNNTIVTLSPSATGIVTQSVVPVFSGQVANTPLGISSLAWINGHLMATSVLNETVMDLST